MKTGDYNGVQLVKRLNQLGDEAACGGVSLFQALRRGGESLQGYGQVCKDKPCITHERGRYSPERDLLTHSRLRLDLAIDMRARLGDWFRVMHLASTGGSSDQMLKMAYVNIGDYYYDRLLWSKANQY